MDQPEVCSNCGITIRWQATLVEGQSYCCLGCAVGGPCECDYDNLPRTSAVTPIVLQPADDPGTGDAG